MAQTELEQIARAMMILAEDPERRRHTSTILHPMSTTAAVLSSSEDCETKDGPTTTGSSISSVEDINAHKEAEEGYEEESEMDECIRDKNGETEEFEEMLGTSNNYSINPTSHSTLTPSSPAGSLKSNESGSCGSSTGGTGVGGGFGGANSRRIFTPQFKQSVLDAFTSDPECVGNQRATARKFNIHRRQVQKWLQQLPKSSDSKDLPSSDEQEQNAKSDNKEADFILSPSSPTSSCSKSTVVPSLPSRSILVGRTAKNTSKPNKSRSTRSQASDNKMPIVAGKGPSIPQASAVSSSPSANLPSSSPLMSLGKGLGNIHHPLFSSNNFMGLSSPLLSLPLALEATHNSRHSHSSPPPRHNHSPVNGINGNGDSPTNGNHNHLSTTAQRMLELVDELCYLYPSEDFSLLRRAMLKNEVSFTKLSPPPRRHNSRKNSSSPVPANDYITQQTLQMIKNQNEYLQLLQSGYANLSHFQDLSEHGSGNGKYASWLNPFAAVAATGYNTSQQGFNGKHGNGLEGNRKRSNGNNNGNGNNNESSSSSYHNFASPKAPISNPKSKTVAAVLAANRNGPQRISYSLPYDKPKRPASQNRRKMVNGGGRPIKSQYPSPPNNIDDDYLDPTSMLEVVTSKSSPVETSMDSYGMDLSTSSVIQRKSLIMTPSSTIRSKAMNKDYGFLSELGLVRKEQEDRERSNGQTSPPVSSLEHFVDNVISLRRTSPQTSSSGSPGCDSNPSTNNHHSQDQSSDRSKDSVLSSYNFDPEVSGDARAVARKFGLNIRVVQKWIREAPTRSIPSLQYNGGGGHHGGENGDDAELEEDERENLMQQQQYRSVIASTSKSLLNSNNGPTTVNKRKNPKPNQICDFTEDDLDENGALDMVVPIKKRRVSTPTPTSA